MDEKYGAEEAHRALLVLRQYIYDEISETMAGEDYQNETRQLLLAAILVELRQVRSVLRDVAAELQDK
jgi:hypothetical protein